MVDPVLDCIRATIAEGVHALGIRAECALMVENSGLRLLFGTDYSRDATPCLPGSHPVARREAWIHAGRPLDAIVDDEWLDIETSIGLVVSMKPERARNARCRLQVIADRERCTHEMRLQRMLEVTFYHEHPEPALETETSDRERARVRRKLEDWAECKRGERELRELLGA